MYHRIFLVLSLLSIFIIFHGQLWANAEIFPATEAAQEKINWKNGYFYINGQPTFITSGEMHYARIPRELWRDRIWRTKQMGFNCIQTYVFWNSTEPKEGQWDFSDNSDLDAWLSLIQEMGMYAIVRVGPYSCAEWEHGGFPSWLTIKPGMVLRDMDDQYNRYADEHLAKIHAIVAKHQIHKGGNVIMVQLENEHSRGWGTDKYPYLMHLYEKAREAGLEIPLFFSGLHHGRDPSGEAPYAVGTSPWFSTEFWTGWIGKYGDMEPEMLNSKIRGTWKIIAFGGAGYNYYVVHGGTNFGYSGDSFDATYDYSSPIGESGQFHNLYGPARRAAFFAQSFSSILTSSENAPTFATLTQGGARVTTRKSPQGTIIFADNFVIPADKLKAAQWIEPVAGALKAEAPAPGKTDVVTKVKVGAQGTFPEGGDLILHPNEIRTVLIDLPWTSACRFASVATNVLLRQEVGGTDTWVCYGTAGDYGEIKLQRAVDSKLPSKYSFNYPMDGNVQELLLDSGDGKKARFLVMNTTQADHTWLVKDKLIVGAAFVQENGNAELPVEGGKLVVYQGPNRTEPTAAPVQPGDLPLLTNWQWREAAQERTPTYDDSKWLSSPFPEAMETHDSFQNRYGWYRTTLKSQGSTSLNLHFMGSNGDAQVFLNGEPTDLKNLVLHDGDNALAIFFKIGPRPKLYSFLGVVGNAAARGIWGPTYSGDKPLAEVNSWQMLKTEGKDTELEILSKTDFDDKAWTSTIFSPAQKEVSLEKNGTYWLRGSFDLPADVKVLVASLPETRRADKKLFLNGQPLMTSKDQNLAVDLTPLMHAGKNVVALRLTANIRRDEKSLVLPHMDLWKGNEPTSWKFRGGIEGLDETAVVGRVTNWSDFLSKPWNEEGTPPAKLPTLWHTSFDYHAKYWETIGLLTPGIPPQSGHVWLNGHNLGEYPQKVPMYMPECWLKEGANDLVVFDIHGVKPEGLKLQRYEVHQTLSSN